MPEFVRSADGTRIAYDCLGSGDPVIVVGGAFNTRSSPYPLVTLLAEHVTAYTFDRRGKGESPESGPYAVEREIEDLAALVAVAGGAAGVYGHSSGAILAIEAAAAGVHITRLAVYEPPYTADPEHPAPADDLGLQAALDAGDPAAAAALFLRITGMDDAAVRSITSAPFWPGLVHLAPTLPHELALTGDGLPPRERLAAITAPTLALAGGRSPAWAARAAVAVASCVADGTVLTVPGQGHDVDQAVLAPLLADFFLGR
ncbi:alpha/beta hydrolase [Cryobacterium sp. MDB1-18-2]|uniref:alpha/beta fold hydrolase n=1 Tax=unclassified Cryobacterium TaxID=2649013 RepID=UPI00106A152F|nr:MULTISPECIES: alpha/beta hydrolase [unclassified Cryobacterium]TFC29730.1 alpha/beta hydrolase [Cryobacterium sp. MDB1-18-2]TFC41019.1 alpha/beta hydrolase [Cryobacterium sp. MDB1-18-1]